MGIMPELAFTDKDKSNRRRRMTATNYFAINEMPQCVRSILQGLYVCFNIP